MRFRRSVSRDPSINAPSHPPSRWARGWYDGAPLSINELAATPGAAGPRAGGWGRFERTWPYWRPRPSETRTSLAAVSSCRDGTCVEHVGAESIVRLRRSFPARRLSAAVEVAGTGRAPRAPERPGLGKRTSAGSRPAGTFDSGRSTAPRSPSRPGRRREGGRSHRRQNPSAPPPVTWCRSVSRGSVHVVTFLSYKRTEGLRSGSIGAARSDGPAGGLAKRGSVAFT